MKYQNTLNFYRRFIKTLMGVFKNDTQNFHKIRLQIKDEIIKNK